MKEGQTVNILEQFTYNGTTWGCIKNGWISMDFVSVDGQTNNNNTTNTNTNTNTTVGTSNGVITADGLRIRSGAGTGYDVVGSLNKGDKVTITSRTMVGNTVWGKISQGWISMEYVNET